MFAFLIYATMFVPRTTVVLTSAYSSGPLGPSIAAVDNVPVGVAFTASLMSKFGKGLTDITEQAFQPVDPSQTSYDGLIAGGYLDPLKELLKLREALYSPVDRDLDYNLREYASNCTARFLQEKRLRVQDIMAASNAWDAARSPSPVLTTTWSNAGAISERTCLDADADLDAALERPVHEAVLQRAIATKIGVKDPAEVLNKLQGPFQSIVGAGATAYDYMFNAIMMNYLVSGADLATARSGDMTYSYIVQSARERRDMTHATEKTLFEDIMRPIMTFFEALVFAVAPLMAFLFVIGPAALKFASKYIKIGRAHV
jgi:conjugal transfer mating pair stabilization protein TraG